VNAYVEIVGRNKRTQTFKGLTNAVLRKVAEAGPEAWAKLPAPVTPSWLRQPLVAAWGRKPMDGIEKAHFAGAPLDLTANGQVSALAGFEGGDWWVQDAAAALPVKLLGDVAGLKVLDLCAAPGGKTLQLAALGADVTAVDVSQTRMARVTDCPTPRMVPSLVR